MGEPERVGALPSGTSRVRWGLPDAFIAWIAGYVGAIAASPFLDPDLPSSQQSVGALLAVLAAQNSGVLVALVLLARTKGLGGLVPDFGLAVRASDGGWVVLGVVLSLVLQLALLPIAELGRLDEPAQEVTRIFERARGLEAVLFALGVVVLGPVVEELLYRGLLLRGLARRLPPTVAVLASALVFALVHVIGDTGAGPIVPALFALGVLAGWRALETGSLSQPILLHSGFNLVTAILILS
jgi:membrane protease YdiL (CAAX protease family)